MQASLVLGRSLALLCHPVPAWRRLPPKGRIALTVGYAGLSYLAALFALIALQN